MTTRSVPSGTAGWPSEAHSSISKLSRPRRAWASLRPAAEESSSSSSPCPVVKRIFGLLEKQFRLYFERAERQRGITGEILLQLLERRLDNAIYRLGFASSRAQARLLVRHGHVRVGDRRVNIPSYILRPGEVMSVSQKYSKNPQFQQSLETAKSRGTPPWLELGEDQTSGKVISLPKREDVGLPVQEQLVVELYSK